MEKDLNMKICFYSQASDHLLIEKIILEERFRSLFKWDELLALIKTAMDAELNK